jgi:hypothetical protein
VRLEGIRRVAVLQQRVFLFYLTILFRNESALKRVAIACANINLLAKRLPNVCLDMGLLGRIVDVAPSNAHANLHATLGFLMIGKFWDPSNRSMIGGFSV